MMPLPLPLPLPLKFRVKRRMLMEMMLLMMMTHLKNSKMPPEMGTQCQFPTNNPVESNTNTTVGMMTALNETPMLYFRLRSFLHEFGLKMDSFDHCDGADYARFQSVFHVQFHFFETFYFFYELSFFWTSYFNLLYSI